MYEMKSFRLPLILVLTLGLFSCGSASEEEGDTTIASDTSETEGNADAETGSDAVTTTPGGPCPKDNGECLVDPSMTFGPGLWVNYIEITGDGTQGNALNVDPEEGEEDCQPEGKCENGLDNALSVLSGFANDGLASGIANGTIRIVGDIMGDTNDTFGLRFYDGVPTETDCDPATTTCSFEAHMSSWNCDCQLISQLEASVEDGVLTAGGDNATFRFLFPIEADLLEILLVRTVMTAEWNESPEGITLDNVIVGGAVVQATLIQNIENYPGETLGSVDKGTISAVIGALLPDVDTDADGENDGVSVGLRMAAIPVTITAISGN